MPQLFTSFIPAEFVEAWTRGDYVIGPRTLDYQYAGLALMLCGFYRYDVWARNTEHSLRDCDPLFGGYAVAYIQGNELNFAGFRLYTDSDIASRDELPLFWKSVFSKFVESVDGETELYFPYRIFSRRPTSRDSKRCAYIRSFTQHLKKRDHLDLTEANILHEHQPGSCRSDLHHILLELSNGAGDSAGEPELRGLCMLRLPSDLRSKQEDEQHDKWDLKLTGQNYGVVGSPILGKVEFKRLNVKFLERVEPKDAVSEAGRH